MSPIRLSADYPYPAELVWDALTDPVALREWLMDNDFKPLEGHEFTFRMPPKPGFDGIVHCRVLRVEPPRVLSYSWTGGWAKRPTTVTWTLTATADGTHIELEHSGLEQGVLGHVLKLMLRGGWGRMLRKGLPGTIARRTDGARGE
jgi:uncharacterized protein YndB with AHSA1/START domain